MKYDRYRRGIKSLRKVLYKKGVEFENQFGEFQFEPRRRIQMTGIWNAKTNNIVAVKNKKGTVFVRRNSIYAGHLLGSTAHKVIPTDKLRVYREHVPNYIKNETIANMYAGDIVSKLLSNKDKAGRVYIFSYNYDVNIDFRGVMNRVSSIMSMQHPTFKNTNYTFKNNPTYSEEDRRENNTRRIYIEIGDFSEQIARDERERRVKNQIANRIIENFDMVHDNIIRNQRRNAYNPVEFTFEFEGETYTGVVNIQHCHSFRETGNFDRDELVSNIRFQEPLQSIPEQEAAFEDPWAGMDEVHRQMYEYATLGRRHSISYQQIRDFYRTTETGGVELRVPTDMTAPAEYVDNGTTFGADVAADVAEDIRPRPGGSFRSRPWVDEAQDMAMPEPMIRPDDDPRAEEAYPF